jgi:hypothetical protein
MQPWFMAGMDISSNRQKLAQSLIEKAGYDGHQVGGLVYSVDVDTGYYRYATTAKHYFSRQTADLPALAGGSANMYVMRRLDDGWQVNTAPLNKPDKLIEFIFQQTGKNREAVHQWLEEIGLSDEQRGILLDEHDLETTSPMLGSADVADLDKLRQDGFDAKCLGFLADYFPGAALRLVTPGMLDESGAPDMEKLAEGTDADMIIAVESWLAAAMRETFEEARIEPARLNALISDLQRNTPHVADMQIHSRRSIEFRLPPTDMRLLVLRDALDVTIQQRVHPGVSVEDSTVIPHEESPVSYTLPQWRECVMAAIEEQGLTCKTLAAINRYHAVRQIAARIDDPGHAVAMDILPEDVANARRHLPSCTSPDECILDGIRLPMQFTAFQARQ